MDFWDSLGNAMVAPRWYAQPPANIELQVIDTGKEVPSFQSRKVELPPLHGFDSLAGAAGSLGRMIC